MQFWCILFPILSHLLRFLCYFNWNWINLNWMVTTISITFNTHEHNNNTTILQFCASIFVFIKNPFSVMLPTSNRNELTLLTYNCISWTGWKTKLSNFQHSSAHCLEKKNIKNNKVIWKTTLLFPRNAVNYITNSSNFLVKQIMKFYVY